MFLDEEHTKLEKRKEQMIQSRLEILDHMLHLMLPDKEKMARAKEQIKKDLFAPTVLLSSEAY